MQSETLKIEHARYVVTLDGARRIIRDGSIVVEDARISRVGKAAELAGVQADRAIDARHLVVTPGFVNADGRSVHTVVVDGRVVVDAYRQSFVDEERLFARVQEIGERLLARTGVTLPRSRWPIV
jgi:cytosine/adenosine deaminase-related metal-dependent hydrolase